MTWNSHRKQGKADKSKWQKKLEQTITTLLQIQTEWSNSNFILAWGNIPQSLPSRSGGPSERGTDQLATRAAADRLISLTAISSDYRITPHPLISQPRTGTQTFRHCRAHNRERERDGLGGKGVSIPARSLEGQNVKRWNGRGREGSRCDGIQDSLHYACQQQWDQGLNDDRCTHRAAGGAERGMKRRERRWGSLVKFPQAEIWGEHGSF